MMMMMIVGGFLEAFLFLFSGDVWEFFWQNPNSSLCCVYELRKGFF
jgi:hypothetical protein